MDGMMDRQMDGHTRTAEGHFYSPPPPTSDDNRLLGLTGDHYQPSYHPLSVL